MQRQEWPNIALLVEGLCTIRETNDFQGVVLNETKLNPSSE